MLANFRRLALFWSSLSGLLLLLLVWLIDLYLFWKFWRIHPEFRLVFLFKPLSLFLQFIKFGLNHFLFLNFPLQSKDLFLLLELCFDFSWWLRLCFAVFPPAFHQPRSGVIRIIIIPWYHKLLSLLPQTIRKHVIDVSWRQDLLTVNALVDILGDSLSHKAFVQNVDDRRPLARLDRKHLANRVP